MQNVSESMILGKNLMVSYLHSPTNGKRLSALGFLLVIVFLLSC